MPFSRTLRIRSSRNRLKQPTQPSSASFLSPSSSCSSSSGDCRLGNGLGSGGTDGGGGGSSNSDRLAGGGGGHRGGTTLGFVKCAWLQLAARCRDNDNDKGREEGGRDNDRDGVDDDDDGDGDFIDEGGRRVSDSGNSGQSRSGISMTKRRQDKQLQDNLADGRPGHHHLRNTTSTNNNNNKSTGKNRRSSSSFPSSWMTPATLLKTAVLVAIAAVGPVIVLKDLGFKGQLLPGSLSSQKDTSSSSSSSSPPSSSKSSSPTPDEANGGWRLADAATLAKFDSDFCNIERVAVGDMDRARFEREFRFKKPAIVTFPNGARDWTDPEKWSVDHLRRSYGEWQVSSGNSVEIVRRGGNGDVTSVLSDYLNDVMQGKNMTPTSYMFDRQFFYDSDLPSTLKIPPFLSNDENLQDSIFFLGASGSGVVFHKHADTWNAVAFGKKRWFLYPMTKTPPGGVYHGFTMLDWYERVYPNLTAAEMPLECVQQGGEILYLPEGYYHATLNLGDTIAVALQNKDPTLITEKIFYEVTALVRELGAPDSDAAKLNERLLDCFLKLKELLPGSAEVNMKLGEKYGDVGYHHRAIEYLQKAIEIDPYFVLAYSILGINYAKLQRDQDAERAYTYAIHLSQGVWDVYQHYSMFLLRKARYADAVPILKKGTELSPETLPFWSYLKVAQEKSGDMEGARASQLKIDELRSKKKE